MRVTAIPIVAALFVGVASVEAQSPTAPASYAMVTPASYEGRLSGGSTSPFVLVADAARRLTATEARAFRDTQLRQTRVSAANRRVGVAVADMFARAGLPYPTDVLFRVFKSERIFEVWGLDPSTDRYVLVANYPVCAVSGHLGPKRRRGDAQVPEGFYAIDLFNPWSRFHLSMRVNYPNDVDRAAGRFDARLGGDIYVHGGCATIGCVPVTDEVIEELYVLAVDARSSGQASIPIHIFPSRMEGAPMRALWEEAGGDWSLWRFWLSLKAGYDHFQTHQREADITVDPDGYYRFEG